MPVMLIPVSAPALDNLTAGIAILAQPQLAAQVHAHLDMATVLDLLYGDPDPLPPSPHATPFQPIAWA